MPENVRLVFKPVPIRYIFVHKLKGMKEIETINIEELSTMAESLYEATRNLISELVMKKIKG